jgi:hypothetical protein
MRKKRQQYKDSRSTRLKKSAANVVRWSDPEARANLSAVMKAHASGDKAQLKRAKAQSAAYAALKRERAAAIERAAALARAAIPHRAPAAARVKTPVVKTPVKRSARS